MEDFVCFLCGEPVDIVEKSGWPPFQEVQKAFPWLVLLECPHGHHFFITEGDIDEEQRPLTAEEIELGLEKCAHCHRAIELDRGAWIDRTGGDVCGWNGGNEPHEPEKEDE